MASTQAPTASGSRVAPISQDHESDSEYEYEYSTTETETYYVTLDLSKADFVARQPSSLPSGRGNYKERAFTDIYAKDRDEIVDTCKQKPKKVHPEQAVTAGEHALEQGKAQQKQDPADQTIDLNEFQILELHSETPLIAYRGRVYEGHWARNIGTELLFAKRDESNPLPAIRQLGKGVDLLAASSARIMLTEKNVRPRDGKVQRTLKDRYENGEFSDPDDETVPAVPDPEPGASAERYEQGDFLSRFIALKKRKGETDEVTVIARLHEEGKKKSGAKKPKEPRKPKQPKQPSSTRGRGRGRGRGSRGGRGTGRGGTQSRNADIADDDSMISEPSNLVSTPMDTEYVRPSTRRQRALSSKNQDKPEDVDMDDAEE
ncbi:hypothetical protein PFICI_13102 [Pestalotiopsis fici W106-1]|uniref:Transcription factor TFIIIC triple barrel domain-containing protein n=1 Tax=Pestalotiopsis fici (strain W106-1 / CGMCC3.15140) TaxID=1229662 RepID=W3WL67_PESFW|nr:uncharacterized protein PFICI_13102 [Pestalotiopsis fici W106-1]ETS74618.1 hypothetical protein PFICI_13102 [Pestalotiopsis fici W106-1]